MNDDYEPFGSDERDRFFENLPTDDDNHLLEEYDTCSTGQSLDTGYDEYVNRPKSPKVILIQRDGRYFWPLLFRQKFDLSHQEVQVRFAGESAEDAGGPLREFLTLCMQRIMRTGLFSGNERVVCFEMSTEALLEKRYCKLGQIVALSILYNGRGPECFHPAIVRSLYGIDQPDKIEPYPDGRF